jgi:acyl-CoA synthetase (AMP-forming)/AMP-acid ligase II
MSSSGPLAQRGEHRLLPARSLVELVDARASATPEAPLLIDEQEQQVSCAEFAERSRRVAADLAEAGLGPGSRVAWQLPTRVSTLLVMVALRRLGAVQAPIIPLYREREVAAALAGARAELFLVPGTWRGVDYVDLAHAADPEMPVRVIEHAAPELQEPLAAAAGDDPGDERWVFFTSGSGGRPRGVRHSDTSLLTTGFGFARHGRLGDEPAEVAAMGFPVAHVGGLQYLIAALAGGYPILLLEAFEPAAATELMRRHHVTTTGGAPPFYSALVALSRAREDRSQRLLPDLRTLKGGGAPCPPALAAAVREELGAVLAHDYGMTEVPMVAVADPADPPEVLDRTDGRVVEGNVVRLVDPTGAQDSGDLAQVPDGTPGEVQVRGAGVCLGLTDPAEHAAAFTTDGWLRTGDLAIRHPGGHLEVVGRLKDVIIRKGENIAAQEVEELIGRHPGVLEVAVIGLPDDERGERVCAVIVPRPGAAVPDLDTVGEFLAGAGLMRQKVPEQIEVLDALPRTGLSKVAKTELRRRFADGAPRAQGPAGPP